jgi:hypothetical protein
MSKNYVGRGRKKGSSSQQTQDRRHEGVEIVVHPFQRSTKYENINKGSLARK